MENEIVLDVKEQALEKIKSLEKVDPDFVFSWLGGLTDLEQKIVANLYQENKAVTIKDVMTQITTNTFYATMLRDGASGKDFPFKSYFEVENRSRVLFNIRKLHPDKSAQITLLKKEIKFPSFRRIDKNIQDLITMGIILKREEPSENKKVKGYYYLNPIIRSQLNKKKK